MKNACLKQTARSLDSYMRLGTGGTLFKRFVLPVHEISTLFE